MIQTHKGQGKNMLTHGFLLAVEVDVDANVDISVVRAKLIDSLAWMEGVGNVDIESLGTIDCYSPGETELSKDSYPSEQPDVIRCYTPGDVKGLDGTA